MSVDIAGRGANRCLGLGCMGSFADHSAPLRVGAARARHRRSGTHCRRGAAAGSHHRNPRHGGFDMASHAAGFLQAAGGGLANATDRRYCLIWYYGRDRYRGAAGSSRCRKHDALAFCLLCSAIGHRVHPCCARSRLGAAVRYGSRAGAFSRAAWHLASIRSECSAGCSPKRSSKWIWGRSMRWS